MEGWLYRVDAVGVRVAIVVGFSADSLVCGCQHDLAHFSWIRIFTCRCILVTIEMEGVIRFSSTWCYYPNHTLLGPMVKSSSFSCYLLDFATSAYIIVTYNG